ncbi:hypothetical protein TNCV_2282181 [Trichonephila clavipes]|nr:hypothetical protein TNCV_2282181 [Trichonephila clavipes]
MIKEWKVSGGCQNDPRPIRSTKLIDRLTSAVQRNSETPHQIDDSHTPKVPTTIRDCSFDKYYPQEKNTCLVSMVLQSPICL